VWDISDQPDFDLLMWINENSERTIFDHPTESIAYNARMLGRPAVFHFYPAQEGTGDIAALLFATEEYCIRISFNSAVLPIVEAEPLVYLSMLESFSLPGYPADELSIPTGWEKGAGLIVDPSRFVFADLPPNERLPYLRGLTGQVEDWNGMPYEISFTLLADEGHHYAIHGEPFRVHFRGLPIDYEYAVSVSRLRDGDRVQVAGRPLASGGVLAQHIAVKANSEWQPWFRKTLFDVEGGEFNSVLLSHYATDEEVDLWLRGTLKQMLPYLVDEQGDPIRPESWPQHLERKGLAHGVLRANGEPHVELQDLYVQKRSNDHQFFANWQQLHPSVGASVSITGTVMKAFPETRVIVLEQPVEGFVTITLAKGGRLVNEEGERLDWDQVSIRMQVEAQGELEETATLLTSEIHFVTP
jgi:hypothetical protein